MKYSMNFSQIDELIRDYCEENKSDADDIEVYSFPQMWGDTSLGFGGIGGQAMTTAQTIVLWSLEHGMAWVAFGGRIAYKIKNPNRQFFVDLHEFGMNEKSKAGLYRQEE